MIYLSSTGDLGGATVEVLSRVMTKPAKRQLLLQTMTNLIAIARSAGLGIPDASPSQPITKPAIGGCAGRRVLLVEDNAVNQKLAVRLLERQGLQVIVAGNGLAALDQLKRSMFDAVLMDCQMPVMDGYEATAQIRSGAAGEASRHVPIIAMTANALTGDKERCLIAGMDDYVSKPISTDHLQSVLERSFARSARLQTTSQMKSDAGAEASTAPIWDVHRLVAMIGDDPAFLSELVTVFLDTMATHVQLLATAPSAGIAPIAHAVKGAAANFHAHRLAASANLLEANARRGAVTQTDLAGLTMAWNETREAVRRYVLSVTDQRAC